MDYWQTDHGYATPLDTVIEDGSRINPCDQNVCMPTYSGRQKHMPMWKATQHFQTEYIRCIGELEGTLNPLTDTFDIRDLSRKLGVDRSELSKKVAANNIRPSTDALRMPVQERLYACNPVVTLDDSLVKRVAEEMVYCSGSSNSFSLKDATKRFKEMYAISVARECIESLPKEWDERVRIRYGIASAASELGVCKNTVQDLVKKYYADEYLNTLVFDDDRKNSSKQRLHDAAIEEIAKAVEKQGQFFSTG